MYGLERIVAANREAARQGVPGARQSVGAKAVVPAPVSVVCVATSRVLGVFPHRYAATHCYEQSLAAGKVRIEPVENGR